MRGSKAKKLRELAYDGTARKYGRNREYSMVLSPGQHNHKMPLTIIADNERALYQTLKGRRGGNESEKLYGVPTVWTHD